MQITRWADIVGYEGRYQVSDTGELRALSFKQRYLLRTGVRYDSITQAAKGAHKSHRTITKNFIKEDTCLA